VPFGDSYELLASECIAMILPKTGEITKAPQLVTAGLRQGHGGEKRPVLCPDEEPSRTPPLLPRIF